MTEPSRPAGVESSPSSASASSEDAVEEWVTLWALFWVFFQMGALGFGGGLTGWLYHEAVHKRKWLMEAEFMSMVTMGQVLPGINIANFSIYLGQRKRGVVGSAVSLFGLVLAPFFIVIGLATIYTQIEQIPWVRDCLIGVAASAVGMMFAICIRSFRHSVKGVVHTGILIGIIVAVGIFRVPMVPVVLVAAPLSVIIAWFMERKKADARG